MPNRLITVAFSAVLLGVLVPRTLGQETLQFDVPYHCPDGTDKIITQCKPWGQGEVCYWRNEQNGRLINEQYNVRSQMDGWLAVCKVEKPAGGMPQPSTAVQNPAQPPPSTLVATPNGRVAAGLNPPYLNELPSPETVKRMIQGSDPTDTLERQVAVFNVLNSRIQHHIAADRTRHGATADEQKVTYAYNLAAFEIEAEYKKTHTKQEADAFFGRHGQYEMDSAIDKEIDTKLLSAAAVAENRANDRSALQQLQAHNDAITRQNEEAKAKAKAEAASSGMSNDPGALTIRRCLELGGDNLECLGKGIGDSFKSMAGIDLAGLSGPERTGITIAGSWQGSDNVLLAFDKAATVTGCGKLLPTPSHYSVTRRGDSMVIEVANQPRPYTVTLGPDGNLDGPGLTDVTGQVIVGYRHYTVYTRRLSDNQIVGERPVEEPIYGPKTERCSVGKMRSTGPVFGGNMMELFSALMSGNSAGENGKTYPPGPRLVGSYVGGDGLKIEFAPEGVVMDCGEAHVARTYRVENTAAAFRVFIDNVGTPLTLTLQPDGSLAGNGAADLAGRLVSGKTASGEITFRPVRASCSLGIIRPQLPRGSAAN